jgi:hypothetical protein
MDSLSITASIITVLQATRAIISFSKETKDAPKELTKVHVEAQNLVILLYELKDYVTGQDTPEPWLRATSRLAIRDGPLDQYKEALEILVSRTTGHGFRRIAQVLAWNIVTDALDQISSGCVVCWVAGARGLVRDWQHDGQECRWRESVPIDDGGQLDAGEVACDGLREMIR